MPSESAAVIEIHESNAAEYLRVGFGIRADAVTSLTGGVSNTVLLIESSEQRFVLKQSLPQLRVAEEWMCDRSRIFRESTALRLLAPLLPEGSIPAVVFEDHDNYAFAMTAAAASETWKAQLLRGETNLAAARSAGFLLGSIIRSTAGYPAASTALGDTTAFSQLRLDPYYAFTGRRHPVTAAFFRALIEDCLQRRVSVVHGDWSPKNLLVSKDGVVAIDWECVHYGNPAFDVAFGLNHLLLKSFHLPTRARDYAELADAFWYSLRAAAPALTWLEESTLRHWSGLLLARIDGKSPVEYITDPQMKVRIRSFALDLIAKPAVGTSEVFGRSLEWH